MLISPDTIALCEETEASALELARRAEQALPEITRRLLNLGVDHPLANLPTSQFRVCVLLRDGPRTMSQLGEGMKVSVSAVTQLADRLEKAGLVERHAVCRAGEGDRRERRLALTPLGTELMESWRRCTVGRFVAAFSHLPSGDQENVVAALETLLAATKRSLRE